MSDPTTLPAADFPDVIREGCALLTLAEITDEYGVLWTPGSPVVALGSVDGGVVATELGRVELAALAIDLTRPSGQWAVAMWIRGVEPMPNDRAGYPPTDFAIFVLDAMTGESDPAELRRVALEVRNAS